MEHNLDRGPSSGNAQNQLLEINEVTEIDEISLYGTVFDEFSLFNEAQLEKSVRQNLSEYPRSDRKSEGRPLELSFCCQNSGVSSDKCHSKSDLRFQGLSNLVQNQYR